MATVTRATTASIDASTAIVQPPLTLTAGEDISAVAMPLEVRSDGMWWRASGAAADSHAKVRGFSARAAKAGQPLTGHGNGVRFAYATGMTPGADLYLSATAGELVTTATTGGTSPIAFAVSATDIIVRGL